jgi:type II secretory pathway pseudopilin PulG
MTENHLYWFQRGSQSHESCCSHADWIYLSNRKPRWHGLPIPWGRRTKDNGRYLSKSEGFTLLEIILVVLLLAIAIVPMVRAFTPAILAAEGEEQITVFTNQARGTLNRTMTLDFDTLNSNLGEPNLESLFGSTVEAAKETFIFRGEQYTPSVVINDASGGAGGLLQLTVTIEPVRLTTLKAQY